MEKEITKLIDFLDEEITLCKKLESMEKEKMGIVLKKDLGLLSDVSDREEKFSKKLDSIEDERQKICNLIGRRLYITDDVTLAKIINSLPADRYEVSIELKKRGENLKEVTKRLKSINSLNNDILEDSLKYFDFSLNLLSNINNELYTKGGVEKPVDDSAVLIDRKA